jgi:hypothetical protein
MAGGVFNKACWCIQFPSMCSQSDYVAARALADPSVYDTLRQPPVVSAPAGNTPPASGSDAQQTVDNLIAQQNAAWQAQNMQSMQETQANLNQFVNDYNQQTQNSIPMWVWLVLGGAGFILLVRR